MPDEEVRYTLRDRIATASLALLADIRALRPSSSRARIRLPVRWG